MVRFRGREGRLSWGLVAGLACALAAGLFSLTPFLERWELNTQDVRFRLRGSRPTGARIVIGAITDDTQRRWPEPLVSWGGHLRAVIEHARALGASWIGIDLIPAVSASADADREFALALVGGRVVLSNARPAGREPINPSPQLINAHREQSVNVGFIDMRPDLDDAVRHAAVFEEDKEGLVPSFPAVLALRLRGQSPEDAAALRALASGRSPAGPQIHGAADTVWINYIGRPGSFPCIPVERLAAGALTGTERRWLRNAAVLIGGTYAGANDLHRGIGGYYYHGVEINAHTLATLLDRRPLRRGARSQEALITAALGLLVAVGVALVPFGWGIVLVFLVGSAWWGLSLRAFASDELWPAASPLLAIGVAWAGHHTGRSLEEAHRRRWIQGVFGRYVSPEIVDYLLRHPEHLELGGVEREASVLVVDIRDYSAFAQGRSPAVVMADLNAFFAAVVPVIDRFQGLVLEYTGDGLLAVFGAPCRLANHAQAAVEAATEIVRVSRQLKGVAQCSALGSQQREALLQPSAERRAPSAAFRVGCSVHSGQVVCGNLGWSQRTEFHVIGDTVNVASRLEELNKAPALNAEFPSELVISQATYDRLTEPPPTRGPFVFTLRGREGEVGVYQVRIRDEEAHIPDVAPGGRALGTE